MQLFAYFSSDFSNLFRNVCDGIFLSHWCDETWLHTTGSYCFWTNDHCGLLWPFSYDFRDGWLFQFIIAIKEMKSFFLFPKLELQCFCVFASTYTTTQVNSTSRWPSAFHFCCVSGPDPGPFHQKQLWQTEEWCLSESGHAGSQSL